MSEQQRPKMRYPKGRIVLVRDSTVAICLNNNPGAVLLSTLLFWYDNPHKFDTYQGDDFTLCRTQAGIEEQACHQIDVKTIHDTAVPLLQLLGYLSVIEKMNGNLYTLHMDRILAGYAAYENGPGCLKAYLKASMQLESALIVMAPSELESALINKSWLYFELERVLIATRAGSNCKRGRKPKSQAASKAKMANTETYRDSLETYDKESVNHAHAFDENDYHFYGTKRQHLIWNCHNWCAGQHGTCEDYCTAIENGWQDDVLTDKIPAVKIGATDGTRPPADHHALLSDQRGNQDSGHPAQAVVSASIPGRAASPPAAAADPHSLQGPQDGATTGVEAGESRASGVTWESILNDWDAVQGRPQSRDARLIKAAKDGVRASPTREELAGCRNWLPTTDRAGKPWYHLHGVALWDVIEKLGAYRSYLALSIEPAPLADMKPVKPIDVYTAAALDPKRNSIEKLKERQQQARLKREAAQQQGGAL